MRRLLLLAIILPFLSYSQNLQSPIGSWQEYLPYQSAIAVTSGSNKIFAATPYSLFTIDRATDEIRRISKIQGLSETGVSTIRYDETAAQLIVAYTNSNIDIIDQNGIHNIPELKREILSGDKTIYQIYSDNTRHYLSTGLGIVVLDASKFEIRESWLIGNSGGFVKTNMFLKTADTYYAATEEGLKKTSALTGNPADFRNWQLLSGSNGLDRAPAKGIVSIGNKLIAWQQDSLFEENGGKWELIFANGWPILSLRSSENKLIVTQRDASGNSQVLLLGDKGTILRKLQQPEVISFPLEGISLENEYWIADLYGGLSRWQGTNFETFKLNSPESIPSGPLAFSHGQLLAAAGSVNEAWNYQYNPNGIFRLQGGTWTNFNRFHNPVLDSLLDFMAVAIDPRDESVWAGSYGGGLAHILNNGPIQVFKQNSPISAPLGDPGSYRIAGLSFDQDNNLWISNFGAPRPLLVLKKDGSWTSFTLPYILRENALSQIVIDEVNQKWITAPLGNGVLVLNDKGTIDNLSDDQWKLYRAGSGNGNLPSNDVYCLAKDKNGFIWIGTADGIGVIQCGDEVFTSGCEAVLPVVKDGSFANYLFKGSSVQAIAVDGANRKWVGTTNGAWLIGADGDQVIQHFTEENSPLLGNSIKSISIDGASGTVYFATDKGLCSFRGTATEASDNKDSTVVFPNPVPPGYNGSIAIRGLPENALVKITELNGRLVFQGRSLGGQAVWNGTDYKGRRAATGVYLVLARTDAGDEKVVTKIVFIK
ncbi:MAG TPA: two-component regulator propeller domain-containing protein [Flavisolibacter sp.]|nr:two-component regulator propeller domain-containing protein [Flavisolibacter sp.]